MCSAGYDVSPLRRLCAGMCGKWLRNRTSVPRVLACWLSDRPTSCGIWKIFLTFDFYILLKQRHIGARIIPCRCISRKKILRVDSWHRAHDMAAMLDHSRHRGESTTKIVKFFVAHTVNCVICNNHTIIDWMLLNFTPVLQQNCHLPGRKFQKSFCAVNSLNFQLELSKSETSQFRSDLVFDIVNYVHVIFLHGGLNVVLRYLMSSDFCFSKILWAINLPESSRCWQHHSSYQITAQLFLILQHMPID